MSPMPGITLMLQAWYQCTGVWVGNVHKLHNQLHILIFGHCCNTKKERWNCLNCSSKGLNPKFRVLWKFLNPKFRVLWKVLDLVFFMALPFSGVYCSPSCLQDRAFTSIWLPLASLALPLLQYALNLVCIYTLWRVVHGSGNLVSSPASFLFWAVSSPVLHQSLLLHA